MFMRVLIVESDPLAGSVLRHLILDLGCHAKVVASAEAALRWFRHEHPDLVLLDARLPGLSAREFLEIREVQESRSAVVVMAETADEPEVQACLELGALERLAKPIVIEHLQRILEDLARGLERSPTVERRRAPRAPVALPVRGRDPQGAEWETASVDLSSYGIRLRSAGPAHPHAAVALSFPSPDGAERFDISSRLIRADLNGYVFHFANLTDGQLERLTLLVRRLSTSR